MIICNTEIKTDLANKRNWWWSVLSDISIDILKTLVEVSGRETAKLQIDCKIGKENEEMLKEILDFSSVQVIILASTVRDANNL